ncbi:hypothetical protein DM02DRAFT_673389 [Periconia macrospinosa]|uniref:Ubiquitin 3 binding protein But2 C-terminal domain-containing protein n=1 Tax=Periconia macrospinosa TaxID=97972 RepID=A0A2V1DK02_9PLEO|nr:hypothetical protein DM02DRAFT_673389 [Periconia macrospinosa]
MKKILLSTISLVASTMALTISASAAGATLTTLAPPAPRPTGSGVPQFTFIPPSEVRSYTGPSDRRPSKSAATTTIRTPVPSGRIRILPTTRVPIPTFGIVVTTRVPVPVSGVEVKARLAPPVGTFSKMPLSPVSSDMPAPVHIKPENVDPDEDGQYVCMVPEGCDSTAVETPEPTEFTATAQPTTLVTSYKRTMPLLPPVP